MVKTMIWPRITEIRQHVLRKLSLKNNRWWRSVPGETRKTSGKVTGLQDMAAGAYSWPWRLSAWLSDDTAYLRSSGKNEGGGIALFVNNIWCKPGDATMNHYCIEQVTYWTVSCEFLSLLSTKRINQCSLHPTIRWSTTSSSSLFNIVN